MPACATEIVRAFSPLHPVTVNECREGLATALVVCTCARRTEGETHALATMGCLAHRLPGVSGPNRPSHGAAQQVPARWPDLACRPTESLPRLGSIHRRADRDWRSDPQPRLARHQPCERATGIVVRRRRRGLWRNAAQLLFAQRACQ